VCWANKGRSLDWKRQAVRPKLGLILAALPIHEYHYESTCVFGRPDDVKVLSYRVTESVLINGNETKLEDTKFCLLLQRLPPTAVNSAL
jgi:hypothetical protein